MKNFEVLVPSLTFTFKSVGIPLVLSNSKVYASFAGMSLPGIFLGVVPSVYCNSSITLVFNCSCKSHFNCLLELIFRETVLVVASKKLFSTKSFIGRLINAFFGYDNYHIVNF